MGIFSLIVMAVGLAMDAFAVSICKGLSLPRVTLKQAGIVGLYFGVFQAAMPVLGYLLARWFSAQIQAFDHWVAFVLLVFVGAKMLIEALRSRSEDAPPDAAGNLSPRAMLPLAVATSIDALAVGVSFAFLQVNIAFAAGLIGVVTLGLSMLGVFIGRLVGAKMTTYAQVLGGAILILLGVKILLEHLELLPF